jgi:L-threonylcarbamoyladenylate synthase
MTAPVLKAGPAATDEAIAVVRRGGLVITPTATNYNLICDATNADAVRRVFEVKRRVKMGPLPVSLPQPSDLVEYGEVPPSFDVRAFDALLPGEVSFIFRQRYPFPDQLSCGLRTVALSVTSDPVFRSIVVGVGPTAATSANLSGQGNIYVTLEKAIEDLGDAVDLIVDAGPTASASATDHPDRVNTIVDLTFDPPFLCRRGWVPTAELAPWLPELVYNPPLYQQKLAERAAAAAR